MFNFLLIYSKLMGEKIQISSDNHSLTKSLKTRRPLSNTFSSMCRSGKVKHHDIPSSINITPINPAVIQAQRYWINNNPANNSIRPDQIWGQVIGEGGQRQYIMHDGGCLVHSRGREKLRMRAESWLPNTTEYQTKPTNVVTKRWCKCWLIYT